MFKLLKSWEKKKKPATQTGPSYKAFAKVHVFQRWYHLCNIDLKYDDGKPSNSLHIHGLVMGICVLKVSRMQSIHVVYQ